MDEWLQQLITILPEGDWYLAAIFIIALCESLPVVGLLVPGSTLIVFAGFLVIHDHGTLPTLVVFSMFGAFLGDLSSFELGRKYGSTILRMRIFQRYRRWVSESELFFVNHGGKSIFFARFLGPIRGITPFVAGLSGMVRRPFNIYTAISALLWGISYPGIGYLGGSSWQKAQSWSARFGLIILLALLVTIVHYLVKNRLSSNRHKDSNSSQ